MLGACTFLRIRVPLGPSPTWTLSRKPQMRQCHQRQIILPGTGKQVLDTVWHKLCLHLCWSMYITMQCCLCPCVAHVLQPLRLDWCSLLTAHYDLGRLDDVMECSPTDSLPQRQHWSRQSLCEPLTAFAAHTEEVLQNVNSCQGIDCSQAAHCSSTQYLHHHQPDTRQCPKHAMPIVHEEAQLLEVPDVLSTGRSIQQRTLDNLDRSCSAMSLS